MLKKYNYILIFVLFVFAGQAVAQFARPSGTVSSSGWSITGPATHHEAIDEVTHDDGVSYVESSTDSTIEVNLSTVTDPGVHDNHTVRIWVYSNKNSLGFNVQLYDDGSAIGTVSSYLPTRNTWDVRTFTLPTGDAASITDYSKLSLRIDITNASKGYLWVTQAELEVPDVVANPPTVTSPLVTEIGSTSARLWADVTSDGGAPPVTARGTVWKTSSPVTAGDAPVSQGTGTGSFSHVRTLTGAANTIVYYAGYATNSQGTSLTSEDSFQTEPSTQEPTAFIDNAGASDMRINWSNTHTGDGVIVLMHQDAAVDANPADETVYSAGSAWPNGDEIGTGNRVMYIGSASNVTVTNLNPGSTYHVAVYAYGGSGSGQAGINYIQTSSATTSQMIMGPPTLTTVSSSNIQATSADLQINISSDGGGTITQHGTTWLVDSPPGVNDNKSTLGTYGGAVPGSFTDSVSGLPHNSQIFYQGYATNADSTAYSNVGSFYTEPDTQEPSAFINNTGPSNMQINWSNTHSGSGVIVLIHENGAVDSNPVDGTVYTGSSVYPNGDQIGSGNYVAYVGPLSNVAVTNLNPGSTYYVSVYAYSGSGPTDPDINYIQTSPATTSQLVIGPPALTTVTSSNMQQTTADLQITVFSDGGGTITEHGTVWLKDSPPGVNDNKSTLGTYGGSVPGSFTDSVAGLPQGSLIYFQGYGTNGDGTTYSNIGTFYTEPSTSASGVNFPTGSSEFMTINWISGSGDGAIIVARSGSAINSNPIDGTLYAGSSVFGNGDDLGGGNYVVYSGSGNSANLQSLSPGTVYHIAVFESKGTGAGAGGVNYKTSSPATNSQLIVGAAQISAPTFASITTTTATLGARVDSDGGGSIDARGTVWNTNVNPDIINHAANVTIDSQTTTGTFSNPVTGLTDGSGIYFRGYVTNSFGTTYSPQGLFYTEATTQVSGLTLQSLQSTRIHLSWTPGSGYGAIVLAKQGGPVDAVPLDGVEYTADKFGVGDQIGTGNYVVYAGTDSYLQIYGLATTTEYHIAVFEYSGIGTGSGGINYTVGTPERTSGTTTLGGHNAAHGIDSCTAQCHNLHTSPILRGTEQETACKAGCHSPGGLADGISVDLEMHSGGSVDCGSCHEMHDNYDFNTTDTHSGGTTAPNVARVRWDTAKYIPGALEPAIFQDPDPTAFMGFTTAPYNGICQSCHTSTGHHTNTGVDVAHPAEIPASAGKPCTECHPHSDGFTPVISEDTPCLSSGCHGDVTSSRRRIDTDLDMTSHHMSGLTSGTWTQADEANCKVCHMEPGSLHMNDVVDLKNPDTGAALTGFATLTRNRASATLEPTVVDVQNNFCFKCHDADGASVTYNPLGDPTHPFADALVPNVLDRFDTSQDNYHPVRGTIASSQCDSLNMAGPWTGVGDLITCFDCHETNGHGGSFQRMALDDIDFDAITAANNETAADALTVGPQVDAFCTRCHSVTAYVDDRNPEDFGSSFGEHGGAIGQHLDFASCYNCHAGLADFANDVIGRPQGGNRQNTHGFSYQWTGTPQTDTDGKWADAMVVGGYMDGHWADIPNTNIYCAGPACNHATGRSSTYFNP